MLATITIISVVLLIAAVITVAVAKAQSTHYFACHNCGKEFKPQWTQLMFEVHAFNEHRLKCLHCGKTGFCTDTQKR